MQHPTHLLRTAGARATVTLLVLAGLALAAGPAAANTTPLDPQLPTTAIVTITPGSGLPGTAISVKLVFTPLGACPDSNAVVLRTKPGPGPGSTIVSFGFTTAQPDGSHLGTVHVPQTAVAGTVYYADGGCIAGPVISPPQPFLVTAPKVRALP